MTKNGAVDLYYDGTKKLETSSTGIDVTGRVTADDLTVENTTGNLSGTFTATNGLGTLEIGGSTGAFIDLKTPASDDFDLRISQDGNFNSVGNFSFIVNTNENGLRVLQNGAVELYHDNTKQCETSSDGLSFPSGKGINFSATANSSGSMSSETLDDYEEGTWTPTIASGTFTSYLNQWYVKVGQQVTCFLYMYNFSDTSSNTHLVIGGLPYAYKTNHEATVTFKMNGGASLASNCMGVWGRIGVVGGSAEISLYTHFNTTGGGVFQYSNLGTAHIMATFTYVTAA